MHGPELPNRTATRLLECVKWRTTLTTSMTQRTSKSRLLPRPADSALAAKLRLARGTTRRTASSVRFRLGRAALMTARKPPASLRQRALQPLPSAAPRSGCLLTR